MTKNKLTSEEIPIKVPKRSPVKHNFKTKSHGVNLEASADVSKNSAEVKLNNSGMTVSNSEIDKYLNEKSLSDVSKVNKNAQMEANVSPKSGDTHSFKMDNYDSAQSDAPLLFLDVNFGVDEVTRIIMYEDDDPIELADAFCKEHKLSHDKQEKLIKIIRHHLKTALDKIEEEPEEL